MGTSSVRRSTALFQKTPAVGDGAKPLTLDLGLREPAKVHGSTKALVTTTTQTEQRVWGQKVRKGDVSTTCASVMATSSHHAHPHGRSREREGYKMKPRGPPD